MFDCVVDLCVDASVLLFVEAELFTDLVSVAEVLRLVELFALFTVERLLVVVAAFLRLVSTVLAFS